MMEKLITLGRKETPASLRLLEARVGKMAAKKIATDLAKRYKERAGGYTRITKLVRRLSDGAKEAVIELV